MKCKSCNNEFNPIFSASGIVQSRICVSCRVSNDMTKRKAKVKESVSIDIKVENKALKTQLKTKAKINTKVKTIPQLIKLAQIQFNTFIRQRDALPGGYFLCPTCGKTKHIEGNYHACHVFSAGHYPALRFNENNVFGGCSSCNYFKHGMSNEYLIWLQGRLEDKDYKELIMIKDYWKSKVWHWDRNTLHGIIEKYKALNLQQGNKF